MPNMDPKKCPMPSQDPNVRNKNFKEVALGYTAEMAVNEAKRCLQCKKPACRTGCPVQIDIPAFIAEVAKGDFEAAYQVIAKSSALPAVCGRVCPQENQCEGKCAWSALWLTGTVKTSTPRLLSRSRTAIRWQLSVQVLPA